jgi:hypothetical protein
MTKLNASYQDQIGKDPRATTRAIVQKYLNDPSEETRAGIKELSTNELLMAQHSKEIWEAFLKTKDLFFKRVVCAKLHHLSERNIGEVLGVSSKAAHDLLTNVSVPKDHLRIFKLAITLNIPWQVIFEKKPIEITFHNYMEYYVNGTAKWMNIEDINQERYDTQGISGYVIQSPSSIFEEEASYITGRWVRSHPEFDYFEFHLSQNPIVDRDLIQKILNIFPLAKTIITTYTPLRPRTRSLWVIHERVEKLNGYKWIVSELNHRSQTIIHYNSK